jgi:hypothetical protein
MAKKSKTRSPKRKARTDLTLRNGRAVKGGGEVTARNGSKAAKYNPFVTIDAPGV